MRIITWNCNGAAGLKNPLIAAERFAGYRELLTRFGGDILVMQEVPKPGAESDQVFWSGQMLGRGISVVLRPEVFPNPSMVDGTRSSLTVDVGGPDGFLVLGVWSCPETTSLRHYVLETRSLLEHHAEAMRGREVVIAGDFNSSPKLSSGRKVTHAELDSYLESEHLVRSAYHTHHAVNQGEESHSTFYLYRHENRAFHIDYCYVPLSWRVTEADVGGHAEWIQYSDHCPVIVDVERAFGRSAAAARGFE